MRRVPRFSLFLVAALISFGLLALSPRPARAQQSQYCGDGICGFDEWCDMDCGGYSACGDYICSPELGEDRYTCTQDCVCGDGICSRGEDSSQCSADCGPPPTCTQDTCTSCGRTVYGDFDYDSIPDSLEYDLAHKFFPNMLLQTFTDDLNESYLYHGKSIPYVVGSIPASGTLCNESFKCLEIRFGTAYFNDVGAEGHMGDSEFYIALVRRTTSWSSAQSDANQWQLVRDFTAAHWGAPFGADTSRFGAYGHCSPNCRMWDNNQSSCLSQSQSAGGRGCTWFGGMCSGGSDAYYQPCSWNSDEGSCYFAGGSCRWIKSQCNPIAAVCDQTAALTGPPTLWVAQSKHGAFHSKVECDSGGFWDYDSCNNSNPPYNLRNYKGQLLQNVGSSTQNASFDTTLQFPNKCSIYHVWSGTDFGSPGVNSWKKVFTTTFKWNTK